jgi:hypothetical protein
MAKLSSVTFVNYRRFAGEVEIPLDRGVNLIVVPPGMGKTTILEAIAWCLLGNDMVPDPRKVPNAEALGAGMTKVAVALKFVNGESLERFALFSVIDDEVEQQGWGWRLFDDQKVIALGDDGGEFTDHAERLFPEACVHANLISGPSLARTAAGGRSGPERAVECSNTWCTTDLSLRCSMEATEIFLRLRPDAPVRTIGYDPEGRLEATVEGPLSTDEIIAAVLSHALAYAKEHATVCPLFLDDPLANSGALDRHRAFSEIVRALPSRQLIFILSDPLDVEALRGIGPDKELEIRG